VALSFFEGRCNRKEDSSNCPNQPVTKETAAHLQPTQNSALRAATAKKKLIGTQNTSRFFATHAKQRRRDFLIGTKFAFSGE
jgi:hypothetical protein